MLSTSWAVVREILILEVAATGSRLYSQWKGYPINQISGNLWSSNTSSRYTFKAISGKSFVKENWEKKIRQGNEGLLNGRGRLKLWQTDFPKMTAKIILVLNALPESCYSPTKRNLFPLSLNLHWSCWLSQWMDYDWSKVLWLLRVG